MECCYTNAVKSTVTKDSCSFFLHLLQSLQDDLPVVFEHLQPGLVLHPAVRNHSHQVEADVVVRLAVGGGEDTGRVSKPLACGSRLSP